MSDVEVTQPSIGGQAPAPIVPGAPRPVADGDGRRAGRVRVSVHRLDGGREEGESDSRVLTAAGFPIYTPPDAEIARWIPARDIKYVVLGAVDDPNLEPDPGDGSP